MSSLENLGPIADRIDPLENGMGAILQVFFEGKMPDGTPLARDLRTALGADLIGALQADEDFMASLRGGFELDSQENQEV